MNIFNEITFKIPKLIGISEKNVQEHLKLYSGYVKNSNLVQDKIVELSQDYDKNAYLIGELNRRFSFEFNGMTNHKYFFEQFEKGPKNINTESRLYKEINKEWGSFENWLKSYKNLALTRGIGWAMLYYDPISKKLINSWVDEQHLGQLNGCNTIIALDMWEHSYVSDYQPSGKKQYIEDFFSNIDWQTIEGRLG
jgi:Fe-Mn family superoxide dismutase